MANLTRAVLAEADLTGADLTGANLPQIHMLVALKWSSKTRWGRHTGEIRARSIEQSHGAYILNPVTGQPTKALVMG
ncbi:pentapeptide repeat-containing protein [Nocardia abscessus]|uniref:pentapeptide repeat-containing protein n=1 Tax=Nocardia abscessus TaxID=120957 RepID=UPI002453DE58|nr:pentapeptide repeat-containing protein [Nocardia abscessus]